MSAVSYDGGHCQVKVVKNGRQVDYMQNTLIIKKLKNKAAKTILILFFIQVLITLLTIRRHY
jgi:hypothetical protein